MPSPSDIVLQLTVNGGAAQTGVVTVDYEDTIVLKLADASGVKRATYRIWEYPDGFAVPAGWTADSGGLGYSVTVANGADAPAFDLPAADPGMWGNYYFSVEVNGRIRDGQLAPDLFDDSLVAQIPSVSGVGDVGFGETNQIDATRQWAGTLKGLVRYVDSQLQLNVVFFGADPTGVADSTAAIQAAIDAAFAAGGGVVIVPPGIYLLGECTLAESLWNFGAAVAPSTFCLIMRDGVTLRGAGVGVSVLLAASPGDTVIAIENGNNQTIEDLEVDGQWSGSGAGHGILGCTGTNDIETTITGLRIRNVYVHDVGSYGIGLQNGLMTDVLIERARIENVGADGIDIKNRSTAEDSKGIFLREIYIDSFGQRTSLSEQTGIDVRGICNLSNIQVVNCGLTGENQIGIRFRPNAPGDTEEWGRRSSLVNFYVRGTDPTLDTIGVHVRCPDVAVSNGTIEDCLLGVEIENDNNSCERAMVSNVSVRNADTCAFRANDGADWSTFTNCKAYGCAATGFSADDEVSSVSFVGCHAVECLTGFASDGRAIVFSACHAVRGAAGAGTKGFDIGSAAAYNRLDGCIADTIELGLENGGAYTGVSNFVAPGCTTRSTGETGPFSAIDFGAKRDGSTNDTTAIQAAIDFVEAQGGGTVWFPRGVYRFTTLTVDNPDVELLGENGTILETTTTNANIIAITADRSGCNKLHVRTSGTATAGAHFRLADDDTYCLNCKSEASFQSYTISGSRVRVEGCRVISSLSNGMRLGNGGSLAAAPVVANNIIQALSGSGNAVIFDNTADAIFSGNQILDSDTGDAIAIDGDNARARIIGNVIAGGGADGISLQSGAANCVIEGNVISGCTDRAIDISAGVSGLICRDNVCTGNGTNRPVVPTYTIDTGAFTLLGDIDVPIIINTEASAASDDLDTISGGRDGQIIMLQALDDGRTVVCKDGTGNLRLAGDFSLTHTDDSITLQFFGSVWRELARTDSAA
jgi:parallel beta-helix repeat protein